MTVSRKVIYKITYPNNKIYVGKDLTDTISYFGSVNADEVAKDFSQDERDNFTVNKQVIWSSFSATDSEVAKREAELIKQYGSNDPKIGYNRWPKWTKK